MLLYIDILLCCQYIKCDRIETTCEKKLNTKIENGEKQDGNRQSWRVYHHMVNYVFGMNTKKNIFRRKSPL